MKLNLTNRSRGLTLTELLVVMLIIGLLATIAIPVYTRRQEDARIRVAMAECREIAHAEEQCAIVHGFYVPFQVLDDLPPPPTGVAPLAGEETIIRDDDSIELIDPFTRSRDQVNATQKVLRQWQTDFDPQVYAMVRNWNGPFMNFQRYFYGPNSADDPPGSAEYLQGGFLFKDFPLDPWGNPYRFYSSAGIIGTSSLVFSPTSTDDFSDGNMTNDDRRFDRYAVVSYGRDGKGDTQSPINTNNPNDIFYIFGSDGVESTFGRNF
ncbi:MAG: prepilin-type N-terminal cleavage/methylation domain-containing protein [Candidatus Sumerlaeaceae bacterium]